MDEEKEQKELKNKGSKAVAGSILSTGAVLLTFALAVCISKGRILKKLL